MIWSFAQWLLVVVGSLFAFLLARSAFAPVLRVLVPMWLPALTMVVAGILLFLTDQGLELGVSLLGASWWQLLALGLALFYWAVGTWQAARLGLARRFGPNKDRWPPRYRPWLRWSPRLLGACAHLFASLSLGFGARLLVDPTAEASLLGGWVVLKLWRLVFLPPFAIASVVAALWVLDTLVSPKTAGVPDGIHPNILPGGGRPSSASRRWPFRLLAWIEALPAHAYRICAAGVHVLLSWIPAVLVRYAGACHRMAALIASVPALLTVVILFALGEGSPAGLLDVLRRAGVLDVTMGKRLPAGLAWGTVAIFLSASSFLLVVMILRNWLDKLVSRDEARLKPLIERLRRVFTAEKQKDAVASALLAIILVAVALGVGLLAWWDPVWLGGITGATVAAFLAFGAYIAVIDLARALVGSDRAFGALCGSLVLVAGLVSARRDFHRVRLCGDRQGSCGLAAAQPWSDPRPTVTQAADAWYRQAARDWPPDRPVPMLIVATAGGGIRAAYWTATVLERLEKDLGAETARRHLFAISGVSGGSVGASAYAASLAGGPSPTQAMAHDFLAPAVAAMAFVDGPSTFLWEHSRGDRGVAIERAWETSTDGRLAQPFLSLFPSAKELESETAGPWRPALLLNATHQATGRRLIAGHLRIESHIFLDSFDALDLLRSDMPASTAAHNSARFSYVSPAGKMVAARGEGTAVGYVLDGGYFENFGALTALQLVREAERAIGRGRVKPIILQISSDPALSRRDRARLPEAEAGPPWEAAAGTSFLPYIEGERFGPRWQERDGSNGVFSRYMNQLTAPLAGVTASRIAHGTVASMELANWVCTARRDRQDRLAEEASQASTTLAAVDQPGEKPVAVGWVGRDEPARFVHLAMCDGERDTVPPLGWVLSQTMRDKIAGREAVQGVAEVTGILDGQCGNAEEWARLKTAFN